MKHGLTAAKHVVLNSEDEEEFDQFKQSIIDHYQPSNPNEHILCERLLMAQWRLRRAVRFEVISTNSSSSGSLATDSGQIPRNHYDFNKLLKYERNIEGQLYRALSKLEELTFRELFSSELARDILLQVVHSLRTCYPTILTNELSTEDLLVAIQYENPTLSLRKLVMATGLKAILEEIGVRRFRELTSKFENGSWYRLNKDMSQLNISNTGGNIFDLIIDKIERFKALRIEQNNTLEYL